MRLLRPLFVSVRVAWPKPGWRALHFIVYSNGTHSFLSGMKKKGNATSFNQILGLAEHNTRFGTNIANLPITAQPHEFYIRFRMVVAVPEDMGALRPRNQSRCPHTILVSFQHSHVDNVPDKFCGFFILRSQECVCPSKVRSGFFPRFLHFKLSPPIGILQTQTGAPINARKEWRIRLIGRT